MRPSQHEYYEAMLRRSSIDLPYKCNLGWPTNAIKNSLDTRPVIIAIPRFPASRIAIVSQGWRSVWFLQISLDFGQKLRKLGEIPCNSDFLSIHPKHGVYRRPSASSAGSAKDDTSLAVLLSRKAIRSMSQESASKSSFILDVRQAQRISCR